MLGSLAEGVTRVQNFLMGEDCIATIDCFKQMGVRIDSSETDVTIHGVGLYGLKKPKDILYCGNSGTTMRILAGLLAFQDFEAVLDGDASLRKRPMMRIVDPLNSMGGNLECENGKYPPIKINAGRKPVVLKYQQPKASAQVKSALLMAALYSEEGVQIEQPSISRDHTERMMRHFGITISENGPSVSVKKGSSFSGRDIFVPGDISSASFFIVAAAIAEKSNVRIKGVGLNPTRTGIIDVMKLMGATIQIENERVLNEEPVGDIHILGSNLKGVTISGDMIPRIIDEIPVLALAAVFSDGETIISDAEELRVKETDRIEAVCSQLKKMNAEIEEKKDGMRIVGTKQLSGASVKTFGDHRMAMMLSLAGMFAEGETTLDDVTCINVSNPTFYKDLEQLKDIRG
jgi:3-phosphoshikimate 1-carboxyvinyltransferase